MNDQKYALMTLSKLAVDVVNETSLKGELFQETLQGALDRVLPDEPDTLRADLYARIVEAEPATYSLLLQVVHRELTNTPGLL